MESIRVGGNTYVLYEDMSHERILEIRNALDREYDKFNEFIRNDERY